MNEESRMTPALSQFVEKLTAVRQTMNSDEQKLLDEMVANTALDVQSHRWITRPQAEELDVTAHRRIMMPRIRFTPAVGYEIAPEAEEDNDVTAHRLIITRD